MHPGAVNLISVRSSSRQLNLCIQHLFAAALELSKRMALVEKRQIGLVVSTSAVLSSPLWLLPSTNF
jgi:hypothetical protein